MEFDIGGANSWSSCRCFRGDRSREGCSDNYAIIVNISVEERGVFGVCRVPVSVQLAMQVLDNLDLEFSAIGCRLGRVVVPGYFGAMKLRSEVGREVVDRGPSVSHRFKL